MIYRDVPSMYIFIINHSQPDAHQLVVHAVSIRDESLSAVLSPCSYLNSFCVASITFDTLQSSLYARA